VKRANKSRCQIYLKQMCFGLYKLTYYCTTSFVLIWRARCEEENNCLDTDHWDLCRFTFSHRLH